MDWRNKWANSEFYVMRTSTQNSQTREREKGGMKSEFNLLNSKRRKSQSGRSQWTSS